MTKQRLCRHCLYGFRSWHLLSNNLSSRFPAKIVEHYSLPWTLSQGASRRYSDRKSSWNDANLSRHDFGQETLENDLGEHASQLSQNQLHVYEQLIANHPSLLENPDQLEEVLAENPELFNLLQLGGKFGLFAPLLV